MITTLVVGVVVVATIFTLKSRWSPEPLPALGGRDSKCWRYKRSERAFAKKMNLARTRSRRAKLSLDPELSKAARVHTNEMLRRNLLYHTSNANLRRRVVGWSTLGENVGVGFAVGSLQKAFMHSPPHRHNILYPSFNNTGVGVTKRGSRMWVTVIFEARRDPGTRLKMPRC